MLTPKKVYPTLTAALAATAVALALASPARAYVWASDTWADGRIVDVQVQVDGRASALYDSPRGDDRHYFQAFAGRNYSLVLRNTTGQRVGVLIAVDGLNVVNGERSRLASSEPMYVLGPYESATIRGWRTSLDDIRRFVFVDEERSYASRTGQANGDMGWIRVLAYQEQRPWWEVRPRARTYEGERRQGFDDRPEARDERGAAPQAAPPAPTAGRSEAQAPMKTDALRKQAAEGGMAQNEAVPGTGWGDHRSDPVQQVEFTAQRTATDRITFRYEYASGLRALGIFPDRDRVRERDRGEVGFAQPPRW